MEQNTGKIVQCPSCGSSVHARATSSKCPYKKTKVSEHGPEEKVEQFTIKTSLHNVCRNNRFIQEVLKIVNYTTKVLFVGSLFANFVFIKILEPKQAVPIIDQSLFTNMFAVVSGNGKRAPEYIREYFTEFCESTGMDSVFLQSMKTIGYSSILSIAGKQYETLVRNHIHDTHERRTIRYFLSVMSDANSEYTCQDLKVASRKSLAYYVYRRKQGLEPPWPSKIPQMKPIQKLLKIYFKCGRKFNHRSVARIPYIRSHICSSNGSISLRKKYTKRFI